MINEEVLKKIETTGRILYTESASKVKESMCNLFDKTEQM